MPVLGAARSEITLVVFGNGHYALKQPTLTGE